MTGPFSNVLAIMKLKERRGRSEKCEGRKRKYKVRANRARRNYKFERESKKNRRVQRERKNE